ncbi:MAG: dihydrolipoyl dehydrogenase family protein [Chitinivibrionales bacterium]
MDILNRLSPLDQYNTELIENVFPQPWINPSPRRIYDLAVIGGGVAGYAAVREAAAHGARVALIQEGPLGGTHLNFAAIPLGSMSHAAWENTPERGSRQKDTDLFSTDTFGKIMESVRETRSKLSKRYRTFTITNEGIHLFYGTGSFNSGKRLSVDGSEIRFKRAIIATGAETDLPDIPGLHQSLYLTHESLFTLTERPHAVAIYGSGAHACEIAQVFGFLGSHVMIINPCESLLPHEDTEISDTIEQIFTDQGIRILHSASIRRVETDEKKRMLHVDWKTTDETFAVDALIISDRLSGAVGSLNLQNAGVECEKGRLKIDSYLRTTNPRIYAAGDCCMKHKYSHLAERSGQIAAHNALFAYKRSISELMIPLSISTVPPIARVGLNRKEASEKGVGFTIHQRDYKDLARSIMDRSPTGFVQVLTQHKSDIIVGATVLGTNATELINLFTLAMQSKIGLKHLDSMLYLSPTYGEIVKHIAENVAHPQISPLKKKLLSIWHKMRN